MLDVVAATGMGNPIQKTLCWISCTRLPNDSQWIRRRDCKNCSSQQYRVCPGRDPNYNNNLLGVVNYWEPPGHGNAVRNAMPSDWQSPPIKNAATSMTQTRSLSHPINNFTLGIHSSMFSPKRWSDVDLLVRLRTIMVLGRPNK